MNKLFVLVFCLVFLNVSLLGFSQITDEEMIPMQKSKTRDYKKKPEKEEKEENKTNDSKNKKDSEDNTDKDSKDQSFKDKMKDKLKKDKEKKSGGRFGDKRF